MKTNNINQIANQQTMTSMQIAEITGKQHKDVLKAIRNMEPAWENVQGRKFALLQRCTATGRGGSKMNPYYSLTRTECLFVATKFNDEARAKLVLRWEQLEKERLQPQPTAEPVTTMPADPRNLSRMQILQLALQAEEENERLRAEKEELEADNYALMIEQGEKNEKIQQLEQKTAYLNVIMSDTSTVTATQIAMDYGMSSKAFNKLLNGLGVQRLVGGQWVLYAEYLNKGYVANRMIPIHHAGSSDTFKPLTVWTQSGRKFLYDILKKNRVLPLIESLHQEGGASC